MGAAPELLRAALDPLLPIHLLVDPLLGEPQALGLPQGASAAQREAAWKRPVQRVPLAPDIDLAPALHPYLVELQGLDDPWLDTSWALAEAEREAAWADGLAGTGRAPWRIGGWLQAACDVTVLAGHLGTLMRLRAQVATSARYLRLADRRTLDALGLILGQARLSAAIPPLRRWLWADSTGAVARLEAAGESAPAEPALRLSGAEWALLAQTERLHPCLARWLGEAGLDAAPSHAHTLTQLARARDALQRAQMACKAWRGPPPSDDDVVAWAALSLLRPGFESHEATASWIRQGRAAAAAPLDAEPVEPFNLHCHALRAACAAPSAVPSATP